MRGRPASEPAKGCGAMVYPHVCGAASDDGCSSPIPTCAARQSGALYIGLSPRVRGRPLPLAVARTRTTTGLSPVRGQPVVSASEHRGLSPRVRGSLHARDRPSGEPAKRARSGNAVYPHVCGAAIHPAGRIHRSIPTCAGQPPSIPQKPNTSNLGLSPRVRGSLERIAVRGSPPPKGSIPACAGQPRPRRLSGVNTLCRLGLSPRVRGSRSSQTCGAASRSRGSIPACAGQPFGNRACSCTGLSPRSQPYALSI